MSTHEQIIRRAVRTAVDMELTARHLGLHPWVFDSIAVDAAGRVLDDLDRHGVALIDWPEDDQVVDPGAALVLPGGAVLDAITYQVGEYSWVYVPHVEGTAADETAARLALMPPWWPDLRYRWLFHTRDVLPAQRHGRIAGVARFVLGEARRAVGHGRARLRRRRPIVTVPIDGLWLVASVVWAISAVVGRFAHRTAQRLDRLACWLEAVADGETGIDL